MTNAGGVALTRKGVLNGYIPCRMLAPLLLAFQIAAVPSGIYHGRSGQTAARVPVADATAAAITVDGRLDEPVWRTAALLTGFSLYEPVDQRPAPDSTEVLVWYSATAIHFGIRAFEPHGAVRATLADRDRISADDYVELHLDTFHERRRAFVFMVNPLGVQADGTKSEGGGFIPGSNVAPGQNDLSADFVWESKGRLTDWGYEVEIRIPFNSLRYPIGGSQSWGLQVNRHVQHSGYAETWTPALKGSASFIAQAGTITGLSGMQHGQVLALNPELTSTISGTPAATAGANWSYKAQQQLGGNVRWGIGSNFVVNGTIRPDFSQVEADASQIAADARFALFYPERRPFFVEGSDQFNVPNTLVYTRRIVQPDAAVKVTGKIGRADLAVLSAIDQAPSGTSVGKPMVDIVRLQQSFGEQSTAGLVYSDRVGAGRSNRVAGADVHLVFQRLYFAQFQVVSSTTSSSSGAQSGPLWDAVVDRTGRTFGFHYNIFGVAPRFSTDNGFVARTGIVSPGIANRITVFGPQGSWFERYTGFLRVAGVWKYDDFFAGRSVLEQSASVTDNFTFRGGWSVNASPTFSRYRFDPAAYANVRTTTSLGALVPFVPSGTLGAAVINISASTPQFRRFAASVGATVGNDVDFFEASQVRRADYNASLDLRPTERLRVSATYVSSSFVRLSDGVRTATTRIPRLKTEYQIARPLFLRLVAQYEASVREPLVDPANGRTLRVKASDGSYAASSSRTTNTLRGDFLFSYRPSPGTVFFAGYGNTMTETQPLAFQQLRRAADAFFVKASYVFRP